MIGRPQLIAAAQGGDAPQHDRHPEFQLPDDDSRRRVLERFLAHLPFEDRAVAVENLVAARHSFSGAQLRELADMHTLLQVESGAPEPGRPRVPAVTAVTPFPLAFGEVNSGAAKMATPEGIRFLADGATQPTCLRSLALALLGVLSSGRPRLLHWEEVRDRDPPRLQRE